MIDDASLYIHVPFCRSKCAYCDFFSVPFPQGPPTQAVEDELQRIRSRGRLLLDTWQARSFESIYIGGGTPSALSPAQLDSYLLLIDFLVPPALRQSEGFEYSIEANPRDITPDFLRQIACRGINRLSLGVQSLDDGVLAYLGRESSKETILKALDLIGTHWERELSVDIIAGVPGQSAEAVYQLIRRAEDTGADHLSIYQLTVEEGTPLAAQIVSRSRAPVGDDEYLQGFKRAAALARERGYRRYEVSAFARPGHESRHNLRYWRLDSYFGLGMAAVSTLVHDDGTALRLKRDREGVHREELSAETLYTERLITGFRMADGIDPYRNMPEVFSPRPLDRLFRRSMDEGILKRIGERYALTEKGFDLMDRFLVDCLDELDHSRRSLFG